MDESESPLRAAVRELLEETGYVSDDLCILGALTPYPSKIIHTNYIVRAKNARKLQGSKREISEDIGDVELVSLGQLKNLLKTSKVQTTYMYAAIALTFPDILCD